MSGASNVICYLSSRDLPNNPEIVKVILELAKRPAALLPSRKYWSWWDEWLDSTY
jgi:hypothetical protein